MKKILLGLLIVAGCSNLSYAAGDAVAGKAKAAACVACHGEGGNSAVPTFPKLAGQNERYLVKQMQDIQCGAKTVDDQKASKCKPRAVVAMAGQLDAMSDQDLADIASYFAAQAGTTGQTKAELALKGEEIYRAGISAKAVAACSACHSPTGAGNGPAGFPSLGGQHADYIAAQLKAFRAAADGLPGRENDGDTQIMRDVAYQLSDSEINAVSSYISGLH